MNAPDHLAAYASRAVLTRGRLHAEPPARNRTCFQRDRDRIIHSAAFRRLQYKTQVFVNHEGDFFRTRLTHSLEVSQITRTICRDLRLDEDLGEALALAHDLGHPPFGHAGEDALKEMMEAYGGFDHNAQSLRVVTFLEQRYADFDGLNLSWETLEGLVKHNGPLLWADAHRDAVATAALPEAIAAYTADHDLELDTYPSAEAQVAAAADDIAYNNHDIDDGLRVGLFTLEALAKVPLVATTLSEIRDVHPNLPFSRLVHELVRRLITQMIDDLIDETRRRLLLAGPTSADAVRHLDHPVVGFSKAMESHDRMLRCFLFENMYRHYTVNRMASKARRVVRELFAQLMNEPDTLPTKWRGRASAHGVRETARAVADYIAGMTDRFALGEHRMLLDVQSRSS